MRVILQRVNWASVTVDGELKGECGPGLMCLVGFGKGDDETKLKPMAEKLANLRVFRNEEDKFDKSLLDIDGGVLLIPQFTLYGETKKGRRPDFFNALEPDKATMLFDKFVNVFKSVGVKHVAQGVFGAYMRVKLENDGPVTLMVEL